MCVLCCAVAVTNTVAVQCTYDVTCMHATCSTTMYYTTRVRVRVRVRVLCVRSALSTGWGGDEAKIDRFGRTRAYLPQENILSHSYMVVPPKPNQIFYAYPLPPSSPFLQSNILQVVYLLIHVFIGYEFSSVEYALVEKPSDPVRIPLSASKPKY